MRTLSFLLLLFLAYLLTGCALHYPTSELVAFQHLPAKKKPGFSLTGSRSFHDNEAILAERISQYKASQGREIRQNNDNQWGGSMHLLKMNATNRYAFSFAAGLGTLGLDATIRLSHQDYFTVSGSYLGGTQVVLQRRMTPPGKGGVMLGLAFRNTYHMFTTKNGDYGRLLRIGPKEGMYLASVGTRIVAITGQGSSSKKTDSKLISVFAGYTPAIQRPTLNITLGISSY